MYTSLAATSETLRHLLEIGMTTDIGPNGLATFFAGAQRFVSLATPQDMRAAGQQGLSVWLYRIVRDEFRLNEPPVIRPAPGGGVEIVPPPLPVRLHYLLTPLAANAPDTEQRILGRTLQVLHSRPIIAGADLQAELAGTDTEIHARLEALSLDDLSLVWQALEGSFQLCVSYELSLANIFSTTDPEPGTLVESVQPEYALIETVEALP
jgi:hypothetical protein